MGSGTFYIDFTLMYMKHNKQGGTSHNGMSLPAYKLYSAIS